jgi:hypothetical protein
LVMLRGETRERLHLLINHVVNRFELEVSLLLACPASWPGPSQVLL